MSKPPHFFVDPSQVSGNSITIAGDDLRHIRTVLRKGPGDRLVLLDGHGLEYTVRIHEVRKDEISTTVIEMVRREVKDPRIVLGQGLPKADKMDLIVQKATELGVSSIVPLMTERTIVKVGDVEKRLTRWRKIAREAAMQSRRLTIPGVEGLRPFSEFLDALDAGPHALFLVPWEEGTEPIRDVLKAYPAVQTIVVLIGPEGGFSLNEAARAKDKGFRAVTLGPNILRTETAAIAVLSMISYEYAVRLP